MRKNRTLLITILLGLFLTNANAQNGEELFADNCAACHKMGMRLVGPDLIGVTERRSEEWTASFISNSTALIESGDADAKAIFEEYKIPMTSFEDALAKEDILAIVEYLKAYKAEVVEVKKETPKPEKTNEVVTKEIDIKKSPMVGVLYSVLFLFGGVIVVMLLIITSNINKYKNGKGNNDLNDKKLNNEK